MKVVTNVSEESTASIFRVEDYLHSGMIKCKKVKVKLSLWFKLAPHHEAY
jgi:hypothetical protein